MHCFVYLICAFFSAITHSVHATESMQVSLYHGQFTEKDLGNALIFSYKPLDSYLVAMDLTYKPDNKWQPLWYLSDSFCKLSISNSAALNLSYVYQGDETGVGFNPHITINFERMLPESLAFNLAYSAGIGVSYYGYLPDKTTHLALADSSQPYKSTRWLCYLMFEWQLSHASLPKWALTWRIHHRSRCYGVFYPKREGIHVGSDYFGLGVRYFF